jgi:hypothetical protein
MEVILDNSVIETGGAVDLELILQAANVVQPATTVLPDILLDCDETIRSCTNAIRSWPHRFQSAGLPANFMFVPQGRTLDEWIFCAEEFARYKQINYWGIPRNVVGTEIESRVGLAHILHALNPNRKIHMLGFSDNLADDIVAAKSGYVHGIDSAVPIRAVTQGIPMRMNRFAEMPPRGDWWESAKYDPNMVLALNTARQWFRS